MKNTFNISRFGRFFITELRLFRTIFLILMGITLINIVWNISGYRNSINEVNAWQDTIIAELKAFEHENPARWQKTSDHWLDVIAKLERTKLGIQPFAMGGAFGLLLWILPFLLYGFVYHPTRGLTYAMLPASRLEKFVSAWVMCVIFAPFLLFGFELLIYYLADLFRIVPVCYHDVFSTSFFTWYYLPTIILQSMAFAGVFFFRDSKIGKTLVVFLLVFFVYNFILVRVGCSTRESMRFLDNLIRNHFWHTIAVPNWIGSILLMLLLWGAALIKFPRTQT